jgi:nicotinamide-nucleotide amidase
VKAEIICVGTELLLGQILNTNARFLSIQLSELGIDLYYETVVGDNKERLSNTFKTALNRSDLIIFSGGLGPTSDDITKEAISDVMDVQIKLHEESLKKIREYFKKINRNMPVNNEKQAYLPTDCFVLKNDEGTAPGCIIEKNNKIVVMLPGPPVELQTMFNRYAKPYLLKKTKDIIHSTVLKFFGIGESDLETRLSMIIEKQSNPTIALYAKPGEVSVRITAKSNNKKTAKGLIEPVEEEIRNIVGDYIYGQDEETLEEVVLKMLKEKGLKISTAESCTGGLLSEKLTGIPGASKSFYQGIITYTNDSKIALLGVKRETLEQHGAVSGKTAEEMAIGIRKKSKTDIGLSITGIAGPTGETEAKPIGLVYLGISTKHKTWSKELRLSGSRNRIRYMATMHILNELRLIL